MQSGESLPVILEKYYGGEVAGVSTTQATLLPITNYSMNTSGLKWNSIEEYHSIFPQEIIEVLQQLRKAIKEAAPQATETISYGMPAFKQNRVLVYYAVHKEHIGFYPTPNPIKIFGNELVKYKTSRGAIQFPLNKPLPLSLIKKIVKFRAEEDLNSAKVKTKKYDS